MLGNNSVKDRAGASIDNQTDYYHRLQEATTKSQISRLYQGWLRISKRQEDKIRCIFHTD